MIMNAVGMEINNELIYRHFADHPHRFGLAFWKTGPE
jgi:hypothetical protein